MATFTKIPFSESTAGEPILIAATATAGTKIHQAAAGSEIYELWAWAHNNHTVPVTLTIEFGGTTAKYKIIVTIPAQEGLFSIIPGLPVIGNVQFAAFAGVTNVINVAGFCNKIV